MKGGVFLSLFSLGFSQTLLSPCLDDVEFLLDLTNINIDYNTALNNCVNLHNAQLASIRSQTEYEFLLSNLMDGADRGNRLVWIGLDRLSAPDGSDPLDPASFDFVDGFADKSFYDVERGSLPWFTDRPNNVQQGNGDEECIEWDFRNNGRKELWNDIPCSSTDAKASLCRRACTQTDSPTTSSPTIETNSPTILPSVSLTESPTDSPTSRVVTDSPTTTLTQQTEAPTSDNTDTESPRSNTTSDLSGDKLIDWAFMGTGIAFAALMLVLIALMANEIPKLRRSKRDLRKTTKELTLATTEYDDLI